MPATFATMSVHSCSPLASTPRPPPNSWRSTAPARRASESIDRRGGAPYPAASQAHARAAAADRAGRVWPAGGDRKYRRILAPAAPADRVPGCGCLRLRRSHGIGRSNHLSDRPGGIEQRGARHAEPRLITISIDRDPAAAGGSEIRVEVADDGRGMAQATPLGYGLIGIRERVRAMGGRLSVVSGPGTGMTVKAAFPCSRDAHPMPSPAGEAETCRS